MKKVSLTAAAREQLDAAKRGTSGRSAQTVYGGHEHALRQTVIALAGGQSLNEHASPGEATVWVLTGRVKLKTSDDEWDAMAGDMLIMPSARHSLHAPEDAVVLLTVVTHQNIKTVLPSDQAVDAAAPIGAGR
jgi:quercetin dioxygenase-like cupin family protein